MTAERSVPTLAAVALVGAGAIHVAMAIAERDRTSVMVVLLLVGAVEVAWGAVALGAERSSTRREAVGLLVALASFGGWLLAVAIGLPFISALGERVEAAAPDLLAALLALVAAASLGRRLLGGDGREATRTARLGPPIAVAIVALVAIVAVPSTSQARRDDRTADAEAAAAEVAAQREGTGATVEEPSSTGTVPPYDPAAPLDFGDVPTVTDAEERAATDLVTSVLDQETSYPSAADAPAQGYRSIGDAFTGEEHFVNWSLVGDGRALDPAAPEALVYDVGADGERTLVAVMFLEPPGTRLADAPTPGGPLTRWHLHGDLCLDPTTEPPSVAGTTDATGSCPDGLEELRRFPTLHVWLVPHPCGPFSELEGVGTDAAAVTGGCEHQHG